MRSRGERSGTSDALFRLLYSVYSIPSAAASGGQHLAASANLMQDRSPERPEIQPRIVETHYSRARHRGCGPALAPNSRGDGFVDYCVRLKEFEIGRFLSAVTDWEQREYFAQL